MSTVDIFSELDRVFMTQALACAREAELSGEVPVGAVVVCNDAVIGRGFNAPIGRHDPTAHAEIQALRQAAAFSGNYRLVDATLYVTMEPCSMCAGSLVHARIKRLVFGAYDPKAGAVSSVFQLLDHNPRQYRVPWQGGLMATQCSALVSDFFKKKRADKAAQK